MNVIVDILTLLRNTDIVSCLPSSSMSTFGFIKHDTHDNIL